MRLFALTVLTVTVAGTLLLTSIGSAAPPRERQDAAVQWIIEDCVRDNRLDREYPLGALRRALDALPRWVRRTTRCERAIERAIDRGRRRLDREVDRIIRDCTFDERLDRDYSLRGLRRALRDLPEDVREYTGCERVIERAIRRAERRLPREVDRILRDCSRDGKLDRRRYENVEALWRALRRGGDHRGCESAIRRAIRRLD